MTNLQLALSIGIPCLLILIGMFQNNARFSAIDNRFTAIDNRFTALESRLDRMGSELNARLERQQSDLAQFYETLGRHDAEILNLKDAQRRA
jgi:archaellum component FlaC